MKYFMIFLLISFPVWAGNPGMVPVGTFTLNDCLESAGGIGVQDSGAPCVSVSSVVSSMSGGTTGLLPNSPTTGAVVLSGILNVANGGTGTSSPSLVQGTNITITGSWPNQTINSTASASPGGAQYNIQLNSGSSTFNGSSNLTSDANNDLLVLGSVGIGTNSPVAPLDVNGAYASTGIVGVSCAANTVNLSTFTVTNGIVTHC